MDYRYLKAFILTATNASFSKAAEELKIAQSAVSRQIKLLEENLGEELIIRSSKKVLLTNKGKELFMAAQNFDKVASDIFSREDQRPINIGILHGLLKHWFAPKLIKYYKKNNRSIYIQIGTPKELRRLLEEGKLDIIFSTENVQSELVSSLKLFEEKLVLISKDEINRKKLQDYRWVIYNQEDNLFLVCKKRSEDIIQVESITTIVDLVKSGLGIAVVPDHVLRKSDNLNIYDLPGLKSSQIYMTTLNYKSMPPHIKEIAKLMS